MTPEQWAQIVGVISDGGVLGILAFALFAMWRGWLVPKRETDDLHATIKTQAEMISMLEKANERMLDEVSKPLAEVLASLPIPTVGRKR